MKNEELTALFTLSDDDNDVLCISLARGRVNNMSEQETEVVVK